MRAPTLFSELLIILLVSVPVAFVCLRLKLPLLVGLMLTGIAIGPFGLGLITELESIEILAEIGVMLLLFTIGLEFSLRRLREMKTLVLFGGGLQVLLTVGIFAALAVLFGRSVTQSVFFGFLVALSSTAIVLKTYVERREVDAPHGRAAIGILLFQDVSIVFMLLAVPILGGQDIVSLTQILIDLGGSLLALILIVFGAWFLLPRFLNTVVPLRSPEVFLLTVVLLCLGMAWVTSQFGLSLALGAFIAGMVLADSDFSHQAIAEILPFRDVFNSIFFVSIGLLLSLAALWENLGTTLALVALLISLKALIVLGVIRLMGLPLRVAVMSGLGLAQIGEFSFVLLKTGRGVNLVPEADYQTFLAASVISMIATPFLIAAAPNAGYFLQSLFGDRKKGLEDESDIHETQTTQGLNKHVIIVGYGLNGRNLSRVLRTVEISHIILDLNGEIIRQAKEKGEKITFGDATRREVLQHVGIERAEAVVLAMSDPAAARRTVHLARQQNANVHIIVRTRYTSEITELLELGANEVIPEEFETSIEIFSRVLHRYGMSRTVIEEQIQRIRSQGYEMLRSSSLPHPVQIGKLNEALSGAVTKTVKIVADSPVIGRSLGELNLRAESGASIIAVIHNSQTKVNPGAGYKLKEGDIAVVLGSENKIEKAVEMLDPDQAEFSGFNA
ncbi:MAG: cation:proton antiporter [Pyrinomonadaceae bacterium]